MFEAVDDLNLPELEERVLARWREHDVFARSLEQRQGAPEWVFYEGPPTANGRPGIHHVWARSFKDLYPRFQTMRGHSVARKGGWDCHGLPVEVQIERELGLESKSEIEAFGVEEFNRRCRASVERYVEDWGALTSRIGMWLDTANAYWTLTNEYVESVWWQLRRIWDADLLYEGFKVVPYCARCGTALSSHEIGLPGAYRDVTEDSIYVRFPLTDLDADLLVWTTTPWTLISNVAAAVHPDVEYIRVRAGEGRDLVMAAARVGAVLGEGAEVVGPVPATELVGRHYRRPFDFVEVTPDANRVVAADFVTTDDGSGIVHLAPAFGEIDREVAEREGLPTVNPVDRDGAFTSEVPPYAGRFVKDADGQITADLRAAGLLEKVEPYTHSYPHCWRCDRPLIYYAKPSWFIRTTARRDELLAQNETIGWHPEHIKHGRFGKWLENNIDWALSRDRFWGTPLPVWRCEEGHDTCIGSVAELSELTGADQSGLDLHRPYVDDVTFTCPAVGCGSTARRLEPVLDAWFDSGAMPAAQFHYPFENAGLIDDETRFPADFICEAIDQTRGWFYSLLAVNTLVFGSTPYRNVVCLAHVVDRDGQKMSKSKGNVVDPWDVLRTKGADALRWYFFSAASPWTNRRFDPDDLDEGFRRFHLTLWNTLKFFVTYARLDDWTPSGPPPAPEHVLDRWLRSRLQATSAEVGDALEHFDALRAAQALERLVDDLSNWYVRLSRARFWGGDGRGDPAAHATLHEALLTIAKLAAPFCPFFADDLYLRLGGRHDSVHLDDWPEPDASLRDEALEVEMALARQLVQLGRAARTDAKVKVRQPLPRALLLIPAGTPLTPDAERLVAAELNVKALEVVTSLEGLIRYSVVPNFRELGPRLGPKMPKLKAALEGADGAQVRGALEADGRYDVDIDGEVVSLGPDDVEVRAQEHEEFALAQEGALAVALDLSVDDDLRLEGLAREVVRAVNDHRKASGLEIADRIALRLAADGDLRTALERHGDWIAGEVLATSWRVADASNGGDDLDIDGHPLRVALDRVSES